MRKIHSTWSWARAEEKDLLNAKLRGTRQRAHLAFVQEYGLACFKCGATENEWAEVGFSEQGPWAVCLRCVSAD
ncbi:MAG: hypothetical protein ACRD3V_11925 [Vicinamibacteria bacterium]